MPWHTIWNIQGNYDIIWSFNSSWPSQCICMTSPDVSGLHKDIRHITINQTNDGLSSKGPNTSYARDILSKLKYFHSQILITIGWNVVHGMQNFKINSVTPVINCLTHWGRVRHICISKQTIIGLDNGLLPGRRQAIIWNNAGTLLIGTLGINFKS